MVLVGLACAAEMPEHITVVMSTGNGKWNTGVWSGYGDGPKVALRWAASGVVVDKSECKMTVPCVVSQDQKLASTADAIVMETVNHPKFLGGAAQRTAFPFPSQSVVNGIKKPLLGMFYYEPSVWYKEYTLNEEMRSHFDFTMEPHASSSIPLSMMCPWGYPKAVFLNSPPSPMPSKLIAYFNDGGLDPYYKEWITWLIHELGHDVDAYYQFRNTPSGPPERVSDKLALMRTYRFVLVTEVVALDDWVAPEFSQALVAGSVPVYIGAENIMEFAPSPDSFVNIRDWVARPATELVAYLRSVSANETAYNKFFEWKHNPSPSFQAKVDQCVYYAECRMCNHIAALMGRSAAHDDRVLQN